MCPESDVRRLLDLEQIRDLPRRYAHCVWTRDVEGALDLFTPDGVMDLGSGTPARGRDALRAAYQGLLGPNVFEPFIHNHVIEFDGDGARGVCYLDLRAVVDGRSLVGAGYYEDTYAIADGRWRFSSRRLCMRYLVPAGVNWGNPPAGVHDSA